MPCWVLPPRPSSQRSLLAGTPASRRSRGLRPTRRCWPRTPRTPRSQPARLRSRAPSTQSSRSSPPCSFPAAAEFLTRRPGRASLLGSSFAEARSQPAPGGSSLCCAGQRRRHAEHHGRLLLRRSGGLGPRGCAAGLLHHRASGRAVGRLPDGHGAGRGDDQRHLGRAAGLLHLGASPVERLPHGARRTRRRRRPSRARCWPTGRAQTRTCSQPTKSPRRWWRTAQPPTRTRLPQASQPRCSATTPSHKWTASLRASLESRRRPRPCK